MKKTLVAIFSVTIVLLITLSALVFLHRPKPVIKPKIVASIFPLYDIARNLVGDKMQVELILPAGVSPHTYEPSPQEATKLTGASVIFVVGYGLDVWAENLVKANAPHARVVKVDKGINLKRVDGSVDPHYFLSALNAYKICQTIFEAVSTLDLKNYKYYLLNKERYQNELLKLHDEGKRKLAGLLDRRLITFHEAFGYFADEFGLEIVATIEPFPGKEPTGQYLAQVSSLIDTYKVKTLFKEPQLSSAVLESLARDKNVQIKNLDPLGGAEGRNSFFETLNYNINTVWESLR